MATFSKTSPSQVITSVGIILLLAGGAGSYFFLAPRLQLASQASDNATTELTGIQGEITELTDDRAKLTTLKSNLAAQNIDIARIQQVLPATEQLPSLYIQIESILQASPGLVNPTYQLGTPVKGAVFGADIPVTFSAGGTYSQLKDVLVKLEQNIRPLSFTTLSITTAAASKPGAPPAPGQKVVAPVTITLTGFARAQSLSGAFVKAASAK